MSDDIVGLISICQGSDQLTAILLATCMSSMIFLNSCRGQSEIMCEFVGDIHPQSQAG